MNYFKEKFIDDPDPVDCPESENFLSEQEMEKFYNYQPSKEECIHNYKTQQCGGSCEQDFLEEITLYILLDHLDNLGFQEYKSEEKKEVDGQIITTVKAVKGFFYDENKALGIIHSSTNLELLPDSLRNKLEDLIEVEHLFMGESYLLAKTKDDIFGFNIKHYRKIEEVIQTINYEFDININKNYVSQNGTVLILEADDETRFIIMGLVGEKFEEEERIILTKKLELAEPFFQFEPYKKVDWSSLKVKKGNTFEALCEVLLHNQEEIIEVQSIGKPNAADRGRDFIVIEEIYDISGKKSIKWLVQCKYSENSISPNTISGWTDRVIEHQVDGYWLMTNNDITPSLYDQLNDVSKNQKIEIKTNIWSRNKFDTLFNLKKELFSKEFFENN